MAEHSRLHIWLNTAIALAAIAISGTSAVVSWKSYSFNIELFGFSSNFTYDCPFAISMTKVKDSEVYTSLGLCWQVTIANQSTSRVSVLRYSGSTSTDGHSSTALLPDVRDRNGKQPATPMSFEGGEARTVTVRFDVPITGALDKIITDAIKSKTARLDTLKDAASIAAEARLDVLGNPVSVAKLPDWGAYVITFPSDCKKTIVTFRVHTGRENVFESQFIYPSESVAFVSSSTNAH